jgi:HlyD family secretion protein
MKKLVLLFAAALAFISCSNNDGFSDAYGNFEVKEIVISSKAVGEILKFDIEEGDHLTRGQLTGQIDTTLLRIKNQQLLNNIASMNAKIESVKLNYKALERQEKLLEKEKKRTEDLYAREAVTEQKLDKITMEHDVTKLKIQSLEKEIESLKEQKSALKTQLDEINEKLTDTRIINPIDGTMLVKYKEPHELVSTGMPLYKIGNLDDMYLKVYVSATQLDDIRVGQAVTVLIDKNATETHRYSGKITWISTTSEFTPKNIQTKEERVDQVYAVKVLVKNDGKIKIGMPGEVNF